MERISAVQKEDITSSDYVKPYRIHYEQNGNKKIWDCIRIHDSVAILIHNITRNVFVLVKQFRPAVYINQAAHLGERGSLIDTNKVPGHLGLTHELCAGIVDKGCSLMEIAQSEILEECGYDVPLSAVEEITTCRSGVGVSGTKQTFYYAQVTDEMRKGPGGGNAHEGEMIDVLEIPVAQSMQFALDTSIEKPVGLIFGIMWYFACKDKESKTNTKNNTVE